MSDATPATPATPSPDANWMEALVALCKRRGFIYPASEIYGGIRGFWDYGPLGVLLKNNIRDHWWNWMVECPPIGPDGEVVDMVGLDSAIIQHPKTWEASGHAATFADPMSSCRQVCKRLFRSDHVPALLEESPWVVSLKKIYEDSSAKPEPVDLQQWARRQGKKLAPGLAYVRACLADDMATVVEFHSNRGDGDFASEIRRLATPIDRRGEDVLPCPECGGDLTEPRPFNLMMISYAGTQQTDENLVYLRPETAQGIFLNFKNVVDTTRIKVPFGVAQVGKSFRNELTPRNFIFRSREFEQMEMEFFCAPDDALTWYAFWKQNRMAWWESLGVKKENLKFRDHDQDELSHYSKATVDIEYKYPFTAPDFGELEGIAHRGDYDLTQHQKHSGQKLDYFDQELQLKLKAEGKPDDEVKARSRYIPNVIEPASGLTRAVLVLLCEAYTPDATRPSGVFLKFKPKFAPIKLGIFPLVNKEGMPEIAKTLYMKLRQKFTCEYDAKQSIGKRYARMDEIGTPFCVTIDGDTLKDGTVTIRHRDTQQQEKLHIDTVEAFIAGKIAE